MGELKYRSLRGMPDLLPGQAQRARLIEDKAKKVFDIFGFEEIRTALLEETEVFIRCIGQDTDIVQKEIYSFTDRGGKKISLRPEGTASVIRAYVEHGLGNRSDVVKLFYSGPMFRGERPQKGRLRQFYQIGAEIIGVSDPYSDAELILTLNAILVSSGIKEHIILLNSLGCLEDRVSYKKVLGEYLSENTEDLCEDCIRRMDTNVLRVLDCKKERCGGIIGKSPDIHEFLCEECSGAYAQLKLILEKENVPFKEKKDMVRGLDYYTGTIFEVEHPSLGAQSALAAGGRYDGLTAEMGGPDAGATGFAIGVERLLLILDEEESIVPLRSRALVVSAGDDLRGEVFSLANKLRASGVACDTDLSGKSFKGQMRKAGRENREYVIIVGEDEMISGKPILKDMAKGEQETLSPEEIVEKIREGKRQI